jgi:hypothetical protein
MFRKLDQNGPFKSFDVKTETKYTDINGKQQIVKNFDKVETSTTFDTIDQFLSSTSIGIIKESDNFAHHFLQCDNIGSDSKMKCILIQDILEDSVGIFKRLLNCDLEYNLGRSAINCLFDNFLQGTEEDYNGETSSLMSINFVIEDNSLEYGMPSEYKVVSTQAKIRKKKIISCSEFHVSSLMSNENFTCSIFYTDSRDRKPKLENNQLLMSSQNGEIQSAPRINYKNIQGTRK